MQTYFVQNVIILWKVPDKQGVQAVDDTRWTGRMSIKIFIIIHFSFLKVITINQNWIRAEHTVFLIKYVFGVF